MPATEIKGSLGGMPLYIDSTDGIVISGTTKRVNALPPLTRQPIGAATMANQNLDAPEEWRPVPSWPDYEVSGLGRIRRCKSNPWYPAGLIIRQCRDKNGYPTVSLTHSGVRRTKRVHRLVCEAFHGQKPSPQHQVAHSNGVPADVRASNLRWATPLENRADMLRHGTRPYGIRSGTAKLTDELVKEIRRIYPTQSQTSIANQFGVARSLIGRIVRREAWPHV